MKRKKFLSKQSCNAFYFSRKETAANFEVFTCKKKKKKKLKLLKCRKKCTKSKKEEQEMMLMKSITKGNCSPDAIHIRVRVGPETSRNNFWPRNCFSPSRIEAGGIATQITSQIPSSGERVKRTDTRTRFHLKSSDVTLQPIG